MFMVPGFAVAVLGMLLLTRLEVGSSYPGVILPGLILLGLGMGTALMPVISLSTHGIRVRDAGVAAAMANTSQQVGGAIGTAMLNTIAASATATYLAGHTSGTKLVHAQSLVHGYTHAIWWAVGIEAAAALIALTLINVGRPGSTQGASSADGTETENVLPTGGVMPPRTFGVIRPSNQPVQFPAQARFDPAAGQPPDLPAPMDYRSGGPRFMRMSADWWDSPPAVASPLRYAAQSASAARRLTGDTLRHWGLASLSEEAMLIVAELAANAVSHTVPSAANSEPEGQYPGLRLLRRPSEVICAVLDPSDAAPALMRPGALEEGGAACSW
jgi:hypothetical protein